MLSNNFGAQINFFLLPWQAKRSKELTKAFLGVIQGRECCPATSQAVDSLESQ